MKNALRGGLSAEARITAALAGILGLTAATRAAETALGELDLNKMVQDVGHPRAGRSYDDKPLSIGGRAFEHGVGTHATSRLYVRLDGRATRFTTYVGVDDDVNKDKRAAKFPVEFRVYCDGKTAFKSKPMRNGDAPEPVSVDLTGVRTLVLTATPAGPGIDFNHADWADARIAYDGDKPLAIDLPAEPAEVLTPAAPATPRVNGACVVGVRPGHPLLHQIAATGERPMTFAADGLPPGVTLDAATGRLTGTPDTAGTYRVRVTAKNASGQAASELRIEVGDTIALTPPMGWNSWNCFADAVSADKVRQAVDAMDKSGLREHGWSYVNIDDCWQIREKEPADKRRTVDGTIRTNDKFPDLKALTDYIHARGFKAGIYSSPGRSTCAGYEGSLNFEANDARQFAEWGFDYLKYDWCSYGRTADEIRRRPDRPAESDVLRHPYARMHAELAKQNRDIVYSLCQYGMGDVSTWGASVGGNCWRTTDDIFDNWGSMSGIGFSQSPHAPNSGPGHWNDPDMLVVGRVGWGPKLRATKLTPNEQYTHISLWSLLAAPMLIGCDLTQLDDFTRGLLTNDEVIAVNQDPLGKAATRVAKVDDTEVWARPLEDGSVAVGLFNRDEVPQKVSVTWSQLGLSGEQAVRDVWRQKNLAAAADGYSAEVARHGVLMLKLTPKAEAAR